MHCIMCVPFSRKSKEGKKLLQEVTFILFHVYDIFL
jgi:hypothetical protein